MGRKLWTYDRLPAYFLPCRYQGQEAIREGLRRPSGSLRFMSNMLAKGYVRRQHPCLRPQHTGLVWCSSCLQPETGEPEVSFCSCLWKHAHLHACQQVTARDN